MQESNSLLQIHEIEGGLMKGQVVRIDMNGIQSGLRQKKDGITYFGYNHQNEKYTDLNDFLFEADKNENSEYSRFLKIRYDFG